MSELAKDILSAKPGTLIFGPIGGLVPGVFPVGVGQVLLADRRARISWRSWWRYRHVLVCVGDGRAVQAMPSGAELIELTGRHFGSDHLHVRPPFVNEETGARVAAAAVAYVGRPYNFLTYGALFARKFKLVLSDRLLRKWISTRRDMMCSQLADQALTDAGFHVFNDGRLPQDVVPAELLRRLLELGAASWTHGGRAARS